MEGFDLVGTANSIYKQGHHSLHSVHIGHSTMLRILFLS